MVVEQQFCAQSYISYLISPTKQPNVLNYIFINDKMVFLMIIESFFEIYFSLKIKLIFHIICKDYGSRKTFSLYFHGKDQG